MHALFLAVQKVGKLDMLIWKLWSPAREKFILLTYITYYVHLYTYVVQKHFSKQKQAKRKILMLLQQRKPNLRNTMITIGTMTGTGMKIRIGNPPKGMARIRNQKRLKNIAHLKKPLRKNHLKRKAPKKNIELLLFSSSLF